MKTFYRPLMIPLSLLLLVGCTSLKQYCGYDSNQLTTISITDRNGLAETTSNEDRIKQYQNTDFLSNQPYQKVLRIYNRDQEGNINAYITTYHPNGQPMQYLEVVNNRAYGKYQEWHSNGVLKVDAFVIGGMADLTPSAENSWLFDGTSCAWDENGNLLGEISYSKGELDGLSTYYHPNGNIWKTVPFKKGKAEGKTEIYFEDGVLLKTIEHQEGLEHGSSKRYWKVDSLAVSEIYYKGRLVTGHYYDQEGQLIAQIERGAGTRAVFGKNSLSQEQEYHEGVIKGLVKAYTEDGILAATYHVKDNQKNGEEIEYYEPLLDKEDLKPMLSISWHKGRIQGSVKTWYRSGTLESQKEMSLNKKNGISTAWYSNGSIMMIEEYDHNKLIKGEYYKKGEKIPITDVSDGVGVATIFDKGGNFIRKIAYHNGRPIDSL